MEKIFKLLHEYRQTAKSLLLCFSFSNYSWGIHSVSVFVSLQLSMWNKVFTCGFECRVMQLSNNYGWMKKGEIRYCYHGVGSSMNNSSQPLQPYHTMSLGSASKTFGPPFQSNFPCVGLESTAFFSLNFLYLKILFCFGFVLFWFCFFKNSILKIRKTLQQDALLRVAYV